MGDGPLGRTAGFLFRVLNGPTLPALLADPLVRSKGAILSSRPKSAGHRAQAWSRLAEGHREAARRGLSRGSTVLC